MRILFLIFLILFIFPVSAHTSVKIQENKIQGTWNTNSSSDDQMILKLKADGTGELDGEAIKYTAKNNKFTITIVAENETHVYYFKLEGNSLTISGDDLEVPMKFSRSEANVKGDK